MALTSNSKNLFGIILIGPLISVYLDQIIILYNYKYFYNQLQIFNKIYVYIKNLLGDYYRLKIILFYKTY